jgi:hypothetical protein
VKLHPLDADLREDLVWDMLPVIEYKGGDESQGYLTRRHFVRKARLRLATWTHEREVRREEKSDD